MLFGEKYPDPVRMVSMGDFSKELCGGTHLTSTGDVQSFEIVGEEGIAAGTRRVVALTGAKAQEHLANVTRALESTAEVLGCPPADAPMAARQLSEQIRDLKKQLSAGNVKGSNVQQLKKSDSSCAIGGIADEVCTPRNGSDIESRNLRCSGTRQ